MNTRVHQKVGSSFVQKLALVLEEQGRLSQAQGSGGARGGHADLAPVGEDGKYAPRKILNVRPGHLRCSGAYVSHI